MLKTSTRQSRDAHPSMRVSKVHALKLLELQKPVREKRCDLGLRWEDSNRTNGAGVDTESQRTEGVKDVCLLMHSFVIDYYVPDTF